MKTWNETAEQFIKSSGHPLAGWLHPGLELHFAPVGEGEPGWDTDPAAGLPRDYRIPRNGRTAPEDNDGPLCYSPYAIANIGWSGWNYRRGLTEFAGFDFDFGHGGAALDAEQIAKLDGQAAALPYVTIATSKGGLGRHWYVRLAEPTQSATRPDHQRVADAVMAQLSADLGFDLAPLVCSYGGIMHVWARNKKPEGFKLIKSAATDLRLPCDWQTLADSIICQKARNGLNDAQRRVFDAELVANNTELDDTHRNIIETMEQAGYFVAVIDVQGKLCIQMHTAGLAHDHATNKRRGAFATTSPGTNPHQPNSYAFLLPNGGLAVRRYGNAAEADCWHKGPSGVSGLNYNISPSLNQACELAGGTPDSRGDYTFDDDARVIEALRQVGIDLEIPTLLRGRSKTIKRKGGMLHIFVPGNASEKLQSLPGWTYYRGYWEFAAKLATQQLALPMYENRIRYTTQDRKKDAWYFLDERGEWIREDISSLKTHIKGLGHSDAETNAILSYHQSRNWRVTQVPFADEYPSERTWNRDGAQLAHKPAPGICFHWYMILDHCGAGLDEAVQANDWCRRHGIFNGGEYLIWWAAVMVRRPEVRLPYLFFFSETQRTGKSTFQNALCRLFKDGKGAVKLHKELTADDFNDALAGAALAYTEELDLSQRPVTYNLIKSYVTDPRIKIRGMYRSAEERDNYSHWVQSANCRNYCPIYPKDERIVCIPVSPFEYEGKPIFRERPWTTEMRAKIDEECPAFLQTLYNVPLPEVGDGRLYLPVLETAAKREAMAEHKAAMQDWFVQLCELADDGEIVAQTAKQTLLRLQTVSDDRRLPKSASGLASAIVQCDERLKQAGYTLSCTDATKHKPALYTITRV